MNFFKTIGAIAKNPKVQKAVLGGIGAVATFLTLLVDQKISDQKLEELVAERLTEISNNQ